VLGGASHDWIERPFFHSLTCERLFGPVFKRLTRRLCCGVGLEVLGMRPDEANLNPRARSRLAILREAERKWDHARALVEQADARRRGAFGGASGASQGWTPEQQLRKVVEQIRSVATDVAHLLSEQPFTEVGEQVQELVLLARGLPSRTMLYRMREAVSAVYHAMQLAEKSLLRQHDSPDTQ
jgi:hypothetical protein